MQWPVFQEFDWPHGFTPATLLFIALVVLTLRVARGERKAAMRAAIVYALSVLGLFVASALRAADYPVAARYARGIAILFAGVGVIQIASILVFRTLLPRLRLAPPRILQDVIFAVAVVVWGLILLHSQGADLTGIITTSAVITAVIGFSLQDTLGNILGGLALQTDRSIEVGDWIQIEEVVGKVVEIGWRQTSIETRDWETAVVPNSVLVKNRFLILGRRRDEPIQHRQWITFNVDFHYSPFRVTTAVTEALGPASIHGVSKRPAPRCLLTDLSGSSASYAVCYWLTDLTAKNPVDSEVRVHVHSALRRAGIPFALPAQNILFAEESQRRALRTEQELEQRVAALHDVDLFEGFEPEELRILAERLKPAPFARGDVMMEQGTQAYWLYLLVSGAADVFVENGRRGRAKVAELRPGDVIGEMGLMTGEPRSATVVARTDSECYRLDKDAFQDLIKSRPAVADQISMLLAKRRAELDATLEHLDAAARATWTADTHQDIRQRIRRFFGLDD
jgi:small-conductance mechanosensitive channel/CRP-like cAMP-binding protein